MACRRVPRIAPGRRCETKRKWMCVGSAMLSPLCAWTGSGGCAPAGGGRRPKYINDQAGGQVTARRVFCSGRTGGRRGGQFDAAAAQCAFLPRSQSTGGSGEGQGVGVAAVLRIANTPNRRLTPPFVRNPIEARRAGEDLPPRSAASGRGPFALHPEPGRTAGAAGAALLARCQNPDQTFNVVIPVRRLLPLLSHVRRSVQFYTGPIGAPQKLHVLLPGLII